MVHLLLLGLLAGNAMKEVYTQEGVADRRGDVYSWIILSLKSDFCC